MGPCINRSSIEKVKDLVENGKGERKKKSLKKKVRGQSSGSATITNRSPSQTPRGRGNRQIQTSTNRTNVRKALRLALSSPSEVIAILKGLKTQEQNDTWKDIQQNAS